MALNITINKVSVAASFAAGATVATAVASEGTTPYVYSLATGSDEFAINSSTGVVTVIAAMNIDNIAPFSVTATDSTSGTAQTGTSGVIYPPIQAKAQSKFNKPNVIYKITKDIYLGGSTLSIPVGCTLDFQGGSFTNGTIILNNTKVLPLGCNIEDYVTATIDGSYKEGQILYDSVLKKMKLWNGTAWVGADGYKALVHKGETVSRPTLTTDDLGFQYYDTTLNKYICWNGTAWVNMDGTPLT